MVNQIQKIIEQSKDPKFIEEVFEFAKKAYGDKKRTTGETFIEHVVSVVSLLVNMGLDSKTVAAGVLHDLANPSITNSRESALKEIEKKFGRDIASIVGKNSDLNKIYYSFTANKKETSFLDSQKTENVRKMFLAIAQDLRVILIELAVRIDGLKKLNQLPQERQKSYAMETLEIFVPVANRLGLGEIKRVLEDAAFAFLYPEKYTWLKDHIQEKYEERQKYLKRFIPHFKKILKHEKIHAVDINYRAKSYWSTYQKLQRHNMNFDEIYDLVAVRLIVKDVANCYRALGIIHKYYQPMSGQIQDYIAKPKENGYKSLHTTVFLEPGKVSEIQIKTEQMHQEALFGICAHWAYKEKLNLKKDTEQMAFAQKIPEFLKDFKIDFFENQVFAFTPKGDILSLPKGSTPIDFAYAVHSDIGNHCEGAKINDKIIPLSQILKNGDVIEIITSKNKKPSYDWLQFVKTGLAKSHIKKLASAFVYPIVYVPSLIKNKIFGPTIIPTSKPHESVAKKTLQIYLAGQRGMLVNIAKCCNPKTGDLAKAYLTKYRAAVLHKTSCINLQRLEKKFPEKIIDATWQ